jgi:hypothetical protein
VRPRGFHYRRTIAPALAPVPRLLIVGVRRLQGPAWLAPATRMACNAVIATGSMWLLQRAI